VRTVLLDRVDRRYHGALRFIDATSGGEVSAALTVRSPNAKLFRNRSGYYVIDRVAGLEAHQTVFSEQPGLPAVGSIRLALAISDAQGHYLPRRASVSLPRDPDPAHAVGAQSLFQPADIELFRSPAAPVSPNWSVIRASIVSQNSGVGLPGVLLRVTKESGGSEIVLGRGLSDGRGEALVAIRGIPITTWESGPGAVLATEVAATLEAVFDPAAPEMPDPDDLETRRAALPKAATPLMLAAGRAITVRLAVTVP